VVRLRRLDDQALADDTVKGRSKWPATSYLVSALTIVIRGLTLISCGYLVPGKASHPFFMPIDCGLLLRYPKLTRIAEGLWGLITTINELIEAYYGVSRRRHT